MRLTSALTLMFVALSSPALVAQETTRLVVQIASIRSDHGHVGCLLFASADGFPGSQAKALQKAHSEIHDGKAVCEFAGMPAGTYGIGVIHDENDNGTLDTNFIGMPKEGVGVSNDAKGFMGPPKFAKASFTFSGGVLNLLIHMKYLL